MALEAAGIEELAPGVATGTPEQLQHLEDFRGTADLTQMGAGGEGAVYPRGDGTRALKRWFKTRLKDFPQAVQQLQAYGAAVNGNPAIAKYVEVVRVYEVGKDWIERDWVNDSVEMKKAPASEPARVAAIDALSGAKGVIEADLRKVLESKSANVHWSPGRGKLIVIDTQ